MKHLLVIYGGHVGGHTEALLEAVCAGARQSVDEVDVRALPALQAGIADLLWAQALLIGTPEHFGYMSGAVKDFMDRTFYPAEGKVDALPYAVFVSAGNDGTGAVNAIERIGLGYRWKKSAEAVIVRGRPSDSDLARCRELGETFAAALALGVL
jgi:multimeric flavodoxin WrbA